MTADDSRGAAGFPTGWFIGAVVAAVLVSSISYFAYRHYHPTYQAAAAIAFDQPKAVAEAPDAGPVQKLSQLRLLYAGLVKTDVVVEPLGRQLNLPAAEVASSAYATVAPNSLLLIVGARNGDSTNARLISEGLAEQIVHYVDVVQHDAHVRPSDRVTAVIVAHPHVAAQIAPTDKRRISVAVLAGILVFAIVIGVGALVRRRP